MTVIAIDPGPTESAFVLYDPGLRQFESMGWEGSNFGKWPNEELIRMVATRGKYQFDVSGSKLAIEMIASYGMPVGAEVFQTCVWIGRFVQAWDGPHELVYRAKVKSHLCNSTKAKDSNVRQALIDRFGGKSAIGTKRAPGPLYGVSGDVWQALAVAVTYSDLGVTLEEA